MVTDLPGLMFTGLHIADYPAFLPEPPTVSLDKWKGSEHEQGESRVGKVSMLTLHRKLLLYEEPRVMNGRLCPLRRGKDRVLSPVAAGVAFTPVAIFTLL